MALQKSAHILGVISTVLALGAALYFNHPLLYLLTACLMVGTTFMQPASLRRHAAENGRAEDAYLSMHHDDERLGRSSRTLGRFGDAIVVFGCTLVFVLAYFIGFRGWITYSLIAIGAAAVVLGAGLSLYARSVQARISRRARLWQQAQE